MKPTAVSFIFDDGFTKSCHMIAEIFESKKWSATFAVLVNHDDFMPDFPKGDFDLWNALQSRGHEIHPHGFDHADLSSMPAPLAKQKIDACLQAFEKQLDGFTAAQSVYHLTYNRSTPEVDAYLLDRVAAIRTTGPEGNPTEGLNDRSALKRRTFACTWNGPNPCDAHLLTSLKKTIQSNALHFCYMLHGLDDEGWGPISHQALMDALEVIEASPNLIYVPIGKFVASPPGGLNHVQ